MECLDEGRSSEKLHGQQEGRTRRAPWLGVIVVLKQIEHTADVGMSNTPRELQLRFESLDHVFSIGDVRPDDLDRDLDLQFEIRRFVDLAHASLT